MSVEINKSDWQETTLGEVANITMGQSPKGETYNLVGDGLPFYQGVTEFGDRYVQIRMYTSAPSKVVDPGTILFSVRAPVGRINFTKHRACIGRGNAGLTMKNGNQDFLFYLLKYSERQIQNRASGTVFTSISGKELKEIPIIIPKNKQDQRSIASVLSSLDNKIELLREQNKTLEAIAQNLFNEWFVEYNFPNGVGKPYKKSGGKMVDGELGGMPEGWRVGRLGEVVKLKQGKYIEAEKISDVKTENAQFPIYGGNGIRGYLQDFVYNTPQVVLTCRGNGCGLIQFTEPRATVSNSCMALEDMKSELSSNYLYLLTSEIDFESVTSGSAQPQITITNVQGLEIIVPEKNILKNFDEVIQSIFEKGRENSAQIQTLSTLRDYLVPRIMSGEVRVCDM